MTRQLAGAAFKRRKWLAALFGAALLPLAVRALIMVEGHFAPRLYDLFGAISDLSIGLLFGAVLVAMFQLSRFALFVGALAWVAIHTAYYEFVREYGSPYVALHADWILNADFVLGSGLSFRHPYLMAGALLATVVLSAIAARGLRPRAFTLGGLLGVHLVLLATLPLSQFSSPWRQRDLFSVNVADIASRLIWPDNIEAELDAGADLLPGYIKADLSGRPFLSADPARPFTNVVIVFIEGISGGQVPSLAMAHGLKPDLQMPMLDSIAGQYLSYSTIITHQKQSNRGLYSALCGDLPRLTAGLAKMSVVADGIALDCLQRVLSDAGYTSLFLNSSNNVFMSMDVFMAKTGFGRVLGSRDFDPGLWRGNWGLDDAGLYGVALQEIEELRKKGKPYFVAVYTSTTHHPFTVPGDDPHEVGDKHRAWDYADRAVADFVRQMQVRGHLEDTLVLITSDEASVTTEADRMKNGTLAGYTENWGLMIALAPEKARGRIDRAFQLADIPVSVLDYLRIDDNRGFMGRSLFRTYETPRTIYSANIYKGLIHEYVEGQSLTVCTEALGNCERFATGGAPLFAFRHARIGGEVEPSRLMRAVRAYSVLGRDRLQIVRNAQ